MSELDHSAHIESLFVGGREVAAWMKKVALLVSEAAGRENCYLYDIEFIGMGKGRALRVYIDKEDGSVALDDCSNVSKALNLLLDVEDLIPGGAYNLEVSTPGLDRHLKAVWHYEKVIGKKVYIKTERSLESFGVTDKKWKSAKTVEAVLDGVTDSSLIFNVDGIELKIPISGIDKAKLVFEMNKKGQKK